MTEDTTSHLRFDLRELNGALGDLGTLLPLSLACIALAGLSAQQVLLGFAVFYLATGLIYRLPVPVQPMKAVAAVVLVAEITPASITLSGVLIGLVLLVLGGSGLIDRIARLVPQSILAGLQLGLGLALGWFALGLMHDAALLGALSLALCVLCLRLRTHAALITILAGAGFGLLTGMERQWTGGAVAGAPWLPPLPGGADIRTAIADLAAPQLVLTLTNAVVLTALIAGDLFGARAAHVTPRRLCLSSGAANLLLAPLGALPMCHGAGGLVAHHRFGARSGGAPIMLAAGLAVLALMPGPMRLAMVGAIPAATLGALLLVAAADLAFSRRLFDARPSCRPVIAATAAATVLVDPLAGLIAGTLAEVARKAILKRRARAAR